MQVELPLDNFHPLRSLLVSSLHMMEFQFTGNLPHRIISHNQCFSLQLEKMHISSGQEHIVSSIKVLQQEQGIRDSQHFENCLTNEKYLNKPSSELVPPIISTYAPCKVTHILVLVETLGFNISRSVAFLPIFNSPIISSVLSQHSRWFYLVLERE
jgi:hypothetical protein